MEEGGGHLTGKAPSTKLRGGVFRQKINKSTIVDTHNTATKYFIFLAAIGQTTTPSTPARF